MTLDANAPDTYFTAAKMSLYHGAQHLYLIDKTRVSHKGTKSTQVGLLSFYKQENGVRTRDI